MLSPLCRQVVETVYIVKVLGGFELISDGLILGSKFWVIVKVLGGFELISDGLILGSKFPRMTRTNREVCL